MVSKERDSFVDIVKGWGILLVIWGHSSLFLFNEIYAFHMPLFFFLSGCFFRWNMRPKDFVKIKFSQLIIPYGIFFLLSLLGYSLMLGLTHRLHEISWETLIGIIPINNKNINVPLWFLYALFWMFLIYYGIRRICDNNLVILLICIGLYLLNYVLFINKIELPCYMGRSLNEIIFMHLGYWCYKIFPSALLLRLPGYIKYLLLPVFGGLFSLFFYLKLLNIEDAPYGINIVTALFGIAMCISFALLLQPVNGLSKVMNYLGTHTLCLFALHLPLFEFARPISKLLWGLNNMMYDIFVFGISLILSVIGGELLMLVFPKYLGKSVFKHEKCN